VVVWHQYMQQQDPKESHVGKQTLAVCVSLAALNQLKLQMLGDQR